MNIPNFNRRRRRLEPVTFVPVEQAFKPQVEVVALTDLNGWVNRDQKVKFHIGKGRHGCIDVDLAREWKAKGYVQVVNGEVPEVSQDELDELLSTKTTITLGG
jgi:hypothetical protein